MVMSPAAATGIVVAAAAAAFGAALSAGFAV